MTSFPEIHGSAGHFDLVRAGAGADLDSAHYDDFMRLVARSGTGRVPSWCSWSSTTFPTGRA